MMPRQWLAVKIVAQQRDVEDLGYVCEARDLVGTGPLCVELAGGRPEGFFDREEALALDESAFYLAVVDGGVDGVAYVLLQY
jgi:hypothetical protein